MVLHIDTEDLDRYGLDMRELWVLTALRVLSSHKPWKGTYEDLKTKSQCGSKASAFRAVEILKGKGLVIETDEGFTTLFHNETKPVQNETSTFQNETESAQNETNSKEKEKNQKKIENTKLKEDKACEYSVTEHARDDVMKIININQSPHYTYPDYYRVALECGYLNPKPLADSFRDYYNDHGWPAGRDKLRMFRTWLNNELRFETGRKPTLTEDERLVLLTFVDKLPKRLMQHFCEQLRRLELTPEKIIFFVDKERHDNFRQWMIDINAVEILAAYNRKVYVRPI